MVFVGRLSEAKGVFDLLSAISILKDAGLRVTADLIGTGQTDEEDRLVRSEAQAKGLEDAICFHGMKTGAEKQAILSGADLFVLPSHMEIFPVSILEAFACGLPVVSTSVGAIPEIVADGKNGILVNVGDVQALASAMRKILKDKPLRMRMGRTNRATVEESYNKNLAVRQISSLIESVISG